MIAWDAILQDTVPTDQQPVINFFRKWIGDTPEANTLEGIQESDDLDLYRALLMALNEINYEILPPTSFANFTDIASPKMLFMGGLLQLLISKGILSARNTLTYNDAGGVTVQDYDKYGRYINWFNVLISSYLSSVRMWKMGVNIENCYTNVPSEYSLGQRIYW